MALLKPSDPAVLAAAVADSLVVASDPDARHSGLYYWELARPWTEALVKAVRETGDPRIRSLGESLLSNPADPGRHASLCSALVEQGPQQPSAAALFDLAWEAECNSRVGYHLGPGRHADPAPVTADELSRWAPGTPLAGDPNAEVLIVVPFRDRQTEGKRLRNLLACLLGLRDQSFPRDRYRVTVVEADEVPRWGDVISRYADRYLFAEKPGMFNKSWAVNVGVMNSPGQAEIVCILDADVLVDRDFVARNAARFARRGTGGHLTYRNMLCLDAASTAWAIRERLGRKAAEADADHLRGFLLRRPPGCCLWVRSGTFRRVGGMDERYEGWGGEDNDFAYRYDVAAAFDSFDDWLLHMSHPPASLVRDDGELVNAHIPALSWRPEEPIGRLDRFATADAAAGN